MKNFEDIARERIVSGIAEKLPVGVQLDPNDVEVFASMVYALLRAGARREGQQGFKDAFEHFTQGAWRSASPEDLEALRAAIINAIDRFGVEARALHIYFELIDHEHWTEDAATEKAMEELE
jgi:hypothetical protein